VKLGGWLPVRLGPAFRSAHSAAWADIRLSVAPGSVGRFPQEIHVPKVPRGLLDDMSQNPSKRNEVDAFRRVCLHLVESSCSSAMARERVHCCSYALKRSCTGSDPPPQPPVESSLPDVRPRKHLSNQYHSAHRRCETSDATDNSDEGMRRSLAASSLSPSHLRWTVARSQSSHPSRMARSSPWAGGRRLSPSIPMVLSVQRGAPILSSSDSAPRAAIGGPSFTDAMLRKQGRIQPETLGWWFRQGCTAQAVCEVVRQESTVALACSSRRMWLRTFCAAGVRRDGRVLRTTAHARQRPPRPAGNG
jgi:hypothetical protein